MESVIELYPKIRISDLSDTFRKELVYFVRRFVICKIFEHATFTKLCEEAINEADLEAVEMMRRKSPPNPESFVIRRTQEELDSYRREIALNLFPFLQGLDTTNDLVKELSVIHRSMNVLHSAKDMRVRCECLDEFTSLEDKMAVKQVKSYLGLIE